MCQKYNKINKFSYLGASTYMSNKIVCKCVCSRDVHMYLLLHE